MAVLRNEFKMFIEIDGTAYVAGKGTASGTMGFNTTTEEKNDITTKNATNTIKAGSWSQPFTMDVNTADPIIVKLLQNLALQKVSETFNVYVLWEFMHKVGEEDLFTAFNMSAVIALASLGGDGQSALQTEFTVANSGDVISGFLDTATATGKYDPVKQTFDPTAFSVNSDDTLSEPFAVA